MSMEKQKILEKINEIIRLSFQINGFEDRTKEKTGNKPTVFFHFSGHVSGFEVSIHSRGWKTDCQADMRFSLYLSDDLIDEMAISNCIKILTFLKEELEEEKAAS